jgi:hypothetical protein
MHHTGGLFLFPANVSLHYISLKGMSKKFLGEGINIVEGVDS